MLLLVPREMKYFDFTLSHRDILKTVSDFAAFHVSPMLSVTGSRHCPGSRDIPSHLWWVKVGSWCVKRN